MAGRLRTQLKRLEAIRDAAVKLHFLIDESAPSGIITDESHEDWLDGKVTDTKADRWHTMLDAAVTCYQSSKDLMEMLRDRIDRLPNHRPLAASKSGADQAVQVTQPVE